MYNMSDSLHHIQPWPRKEAVSWKDNGCRNLPGDHCIRRQAITKSSNRGAQQARGRTQPRSAQPHAPRQKKTAAEKLTPPPAQAAPARTPERASVNRDSPYIRSLPLSNATRVAIGADVVSDRQGPKLSPQGPKFVSSASPACRPGCPQHTIGTYCGRTNRITCISRQAWCVALAQRRSSDNRAWRPCAALRPAHRRLRRARMT
jgi:hypothetical protein